jgi:hypothetical protein
MTDSKTTPQPSGLLARENANAFSIATYNRPLSEMSAEWRALWLSVVVHDTMQALMPEMASEDRQALADLVWEVATAATTAKGEE